MIPRLSIISVLACLVACSEHAADTQVSVNQKSDAVTLNYKVTGMHCDACANAIQARLAKMNGVDEATVSFESSSATVKTHDPAISQTILAAIKDMQFEAEPVEAFAAPQETAAN